VLGVIIWVIVNWHTGVKEGCKITLFASQIFFSPSEYER
jgi:hypothetical protein